MQDAGNSTGKYAYGSMSCMSYEVDANALKDTWRIDSILAKGRPPHVKEQQGIWKRTFWEAGSR